MSMTHKARELADAIAAGRMSRRDVSRALGAVGLGAVTLPVTRRRAAAESNLQILEWGGYEDPNFHQPYLAKYGTSPAFALFGEEEEALQKLRGGFACDISHPCTGSTRRWKDAGQLTPLDPARIEGWGDIFPDFMTIKGVYVDEVPYMMPFDWGNSSILYRTDMVDIEEEAWAILLDERYKGRVAMSDSVDSMFSVAALIAGIEDPFNLTDEQIETCRQVMRKIQENLRFYWNDVTTFEQALAAGEIVAAYSWNESILKLKEQGIPVKYMNPKEGILTWVCGLVRVSSGSAPEEEVYDYLNALNAPETGKYLIEAWGYGHANTKSLELVPPDRLDELGIKDAKTLLSQGVFYDEIPADIREKMIAVFDEVKAGM
jgi:spermidine/putrescine-binding protein